MLCGFLPSFILAGYTCVCTMFVSIIIRKDLSSCNYRPVKNNTFETICKWNIEYLKQRQCNIPILAFSTKSGKYTCLFITIALLAWFSESTLVFMFSARKWQKAPGDDAGSSHDNVGQPHTHWHLVTLRSAPKPWKRKTG